MALGKKSAGILLYRRMPGLEFLLAHPGGPFWARKDLGSWSIPKGEFEEEEPEAAALREFFEETGHELKLPLFSLGEIRQKSGKVVHGFAKEQNLDVSDFSSNHIEIEWPKSSGRLISIPEIDRLEWFGYETACAKIMPAQQPFLDRLKDMVG